MQYCVRRLEKATATQGPRERSKFRGMYDGLGECRGIFSEEISKKKRKKQAKFAFFAGKN